MARNYRVRWLMAFVFVAVIVTVIALSGHGGPAYDDCAPRCLP